jgi:hypothetical protein
MNNSNHIFTSSQITGQAAIDASGCFTGSEIGDGISYSFPAGTLTGMNWLTFDFLVHGKHLLIFEMALVESASGRRFTLLYSGLNECEARLRMQMDAVQQNRWQYEREGAFLKPLCGGDRVTPELVDRVNITILRKAPGVVHWTQTTLEARVEEPELLQNPRLPAGKIVDEFGQSTLHEWPLKTRSKKEMIDRLQGQLADAATQNFPPIYSRYGGWIDKKIDGTGFFRTYNDGNRWWLVDPDGYLFWSAGLDCVRVDTDSNIAGIHDALTWLPDADSKFGAALSGRQNYDGIKYLACNLIRAFGKEKWHENWAKISLGQMREWGFNTVANWSEWNIAADAGFPYVRPMQFNPQNTPMIYRDFPDVFSDEFITDADSYAEQLKDTAEDPAFIGYFLMNEPTWGFSSETPAAGMLFTNPKSKTRTKLAEFLREKYCSDAELAKNWQIECTFDSVAEGDWRTILTENAQADLADFSSLMVDRYFGTLTEACRRVDPNHLNLGARYYTVPPDWAVQGMSHFDVFSVNCYDKVVNKNLQKASEMLNMPVMVGEWHFGALDAGLPGSGIGHVKDQAERGKAYRRYVEDAAAQPWCIGTHYFTQYDESCLGRFDGENWNIGFLDTCNRPYQYMVESAKIAHNNVYPIANGVKEPYQGPVEYLPLLFL